VLVGGKLERFHRSLRAQCPTGRLLRSLSFAHATVDELVEFYNAQRPHQSLEKRASIPRSHT
jgi:transposase InsO family protein